MGVRLYNPTQSLQGRNAETLETLPPLTDFIVSQYLQEFEENVRVQSFHPTEDERRNAGGEVVTSQVLHHRSLSSAAPCDVPDTNYGYGESAKTTT